MNEITLAIGGLGTPELLVIAVVIFLLLARPVYRNSLNRWDKVNELLKRD